jgi:hypothetical protein
MDVFSLFKKRVEPKKEIVTKAGWYNHKLIPPNAGEKIKIDCGESGIREAVYLDRRFPFLTFTLTDCTHPAQNMNMPESYILGWKPLNRSVTEDVEFEVIEPKQLTQ